MELERRCNFIQAQRPTDVFKKDDDLPHASEASFLEAGLRMPQPSRHLPALQGLTQEHHARRAGLGDFGTRASPPLQLVHANVLANALPTSPRFAHPTAAQGHSRLHAAKAARVDHSQPAHLDEKDTAHRQPLESAASTLALHSPVAGTQQTEYPNAHIHPHHQSFAAPHQQLKPLRSDISLMAGQHHVTLPRQASLAQHQDSKKPAHHAAWTAQDQRLQEAGMAFLFCILGSLCLTRGQSVYLDVRDGSEQRLHACDE